MAQAAMTSKDKPGLLNKYGDILLALGIVGILLLMIVPLTPMMLDFMLITSISLAMFILLIGIYVTKPLEFSIFPTVLLLATFFRLALNLASTRLILLHGDQGHAAAGQVIKAFGEFVVGGDEIVGLVIYIILNVINFIVITKGSGRISEVSARFTLDAMPGKQLAIDADLNAGIINEKQAKDRREEVQREADFYGAMDGASKFVRGDAIAGILITCVNIIGGFIIGMVKAGMSFTDALSVYTILTIGDGLVTQIPALVISFAAGLIVTKVSKDTNLQTQISTQFFGQYRPLAVVSIILVAICLVPGLPRSYFIGAAAIAGYASYLIYSKMKKAEIQQQLAPQSKTESKDGKAESDMPITLDVLEIEIGYDLVPLVNSKTNNDLVKRILALRKQFAQELGILVPPIHIQDNLQLRGNEYRILLKSVPVGKGELMPGHYLAMESGRLIRTVDGIPTREPTYNLPALWVPESKKEDAIVAGYTVVDLGSVLATHLSEVVRRSSWQILNRQDLQLLLDEFKKTYPKVVTDLIPDLLPFGTVLKVMQNLLREKIPIRDLLTILETMASEASHTKDPFYLTEFVRQSLGRMIAHLHSPEGKLRAISIDKLLEDKLQASIEMTPTGPELHVDPVTSKKLVEAVSDKYTQHATPEGFPVVVCSQNIRPHLYNLLEKFIPAVAVLSHNEIAGHAEVGIVDSVGEQK